MTSIEDVLKLDNSRRSRIQRLLVTCCASTKGAARPEHEIQVDFDGRSIGKPKIVVSVRSDDASWSERALSEVEEQVERTSLHDVPQRLALVVLAISAILTFLFLVVSPLNAWNSTYRNADVMWLRSRDVDYIEQILKRDRTITDDEMRDITTRQLRNVLEGSIRSQPGGLTQQKYLSEFHSWPYSCAPSISCWGAILMQCFYGVTRLSDTTRWSATAELFGVPSSLV